jgi:hypothetical protein
VQKPFFILAILAACFLPQVSRAQTNQTNVTATVLDSQGIPYANGTYNVQLIFSGTNPKVNGASIGGFFNGGTDATGSFSIALWPNASIVTTPPGSSQWQFTVCVSPGVQSPLGTGGQCTPPTAVTISGASQSISATLSAAAPKLANIALGAANVTSVSATAPIVATPNPITGAGTISCPTCNTSSPAGSSASGQSLVNVSGSVTGANPLTWTRQGSIIGTPYSYGTTSFQEPSCWIQTSPQLLATGYSQVQACVFTQQGSSINYAEAPSPQGPFSIRPTPVITNAGCASNVLTIGGQLVMFACNSRIDIHRYHSTTHGISWVDDGAAVTHNTQSWYSASADNSAFLVVGGVCYLWFDGNASGQNYSQGLMTGNSTCDVGSFTEQSGDPQIPFTELNGGGMWVFYDGTDFWQWELGGVTTASAYPSILYFAKLNRNGAGAVGHTHTVIMTARFQDEGGGLTTINSQLADPALLEWPYAQGDARNSTYLFHTTCSNNCVSPSQQQMTINVASIPLPMKSIVQMTQSDTGVQPAHSGWQFINGISSNTPLPVPTAFDNANRPNNANGLGIDWGSTYGGTLATIVSNQFQPFLVNGASRSLYLRVQPSADQFSAIQLIAAASTSTTGPLVRGSLSDTTFDECVTVNALGVSQLITIRKYVHGVGFTTVGTVTATPQANDWLVLKAQGTNLTCTLYDPAGNSTASGTESLIFTGLPGFTMNDTAAAANAITDNWSGGSIYGPGSWATQQPQIVTASQFYATPPISSGAGAALTGTGACATITTQSGGSWAGTFKCTGTTAASTITITFTATLTAPNGWTCNVWDETTRANNPSQTAHLTTACTVTAASITQNDVFSWSATPW